MARPKIDKELAVVQTVDISPPPSIPESQHDEWKNLLELLPLNQVTCADVDSLERYVAHLSRWRQLEEMALLFERHLVGLLREQENPTNPEDRTNVEAVVLLGKKIASAQKQSSSINRQQIAASSECTNLARSLRLTRHARRDSRVAGIEVRNNSTGSVEGTGRQSKAKKTPWQYDGTNSDN